MKRGKGIVVEMAARNKVIVLTSQGEFMRIPFSKPVCVGQEICFTLKKRPTFWQWSMAAVVFLAIVGSAGVVNDSLPIPGGMEASYFVTLDINPSIELALNREQRVVSVEGINDEGHTLISKTNVIGRPFKQAIEIIGSQAEIDGYLRVGENEITVTITTDEKADSKLKKLEHMRLERRETDISSQLEGAVRDAFSVFYQVEVSVWQVPVDVRHEVRRAGITPAHYIAVYVERHEPVVDSEGTRSRSTVVTTTLERNGEVQMFEFHVTRPVLTPMSLTRAAP